MKADEVMEKERGEGREGEREEGGRERERENGKRQRNEERKD